MALQWGIGHRLLVQAGLGILLVAGIVVVDRVSSHAVSGLTLATQRQGVVVENAIQLGALARRAQALAAETRLVVDPAGLEPVPGAIAALRQEADGFAEAALAAAASDEEREGLDKARGAVRAYLAAVEEIAAAQRDRLAARTAQSELSLQWDARMIDLSKHPKLAGNPDFELAAAQIGDLVKSARIAMWKLDATHDASLRASVLFTLADAEKRVKKLQGKISDGSSEDVLGLRAVIGKLRDGMGASADAEALQAKLVAEKLAPLRDQTNGQIHALQTAAHDRGTAARDELDRELSRTALVSSGLGLLTLLLLVGGALAIMLGVARPIRRIAETLTALVQGRRDVVVPFVDRTDEIGAAAQAAEAFRQNLDRTAALEAEERDRSGQKAALAAEMAAIVQEVSGVVQAAAHGDFSRRATARTSQPDLNALVDGINAINDAVDRATAEFADVLAAVARGDLTRAVQTPYAGRFDDLKASVNLMLERLSETVATIQATTAGVDGAAQDITSGAEDLSRRTEGQAASLEETAATTEELAASVKASAQASARAVTLADEATRVAEHGGAIVREAVAAMGLIEEASRRISDITGVIDEIAFQTNLLALNAAVEAARAGDAGKGFAVVASEVRTLAQRSSAAAKDITGLIQSSTGQVSQGVELVRATGASLEQIVTAAQSVSATVGEIAAAAREQAGGIDEMSQSVAHMDEMTQQNAALADASARSAAALTEQVAQLSALVAGFRTRAGRRSRAAAPQAQAFSMAS